MPTFYYITTKTFYNKNAKTIYNTEGMILCYRYKYYS